MTFSAHSQASEKMKYKARVPHARASRLLPSKTAQIALVAVILACIAILVSNDFILSQINTASYVAIGCSITFVISLAWHDMQRSTTQSQLSEHNAGSIQGVLEQRISERAVDLITSETARAAESQRLAQFGQLSQGLFHDLMSPLTAIALYLERLAPTTDTAEAREMIHKVSTASSHMKSFMDSVRRCLGDRENRPEQAQLKKEILIVRDILAYKARLANVEVRVRTMPNVTLPIHPIRLHQLVLNLVTNAIEACTGNTLPDSVVEISVRHTPADTTLIVSDNGCGIPSDTVNSLFEHPHTTKPGGTGLGLMTVKSVVENDLRGTISVASREGHGSTFTVKIPHATSTGA
jgi:C4-dicarboxylate-specific signal transduction histidine kinase